MIQHIMVMENLCIRSLQNSLVANLSVNTCDKRSKLVTPSASKKHVLLKCFVLTLESEWYTYAALSM